MLGKAGSAFLAAVGVSVALAGLLCMLTGALYPSHSWTMYWGPLSISYSPDWYYRLGGLAASLGPGLTVYALLARRRESDEIG